MSFPKSEALKIATLPNGVQLSYVRQGTGAPLVFVHGTMSDYSMWSAQFSALASQYDCISYSRRYAYPNDNLPIVSDYSALKDARDLALFMDASVGEDFEAQIFEL